MLKEDQLEIIGKLVTNAAPVLGEKEKVKS